MPGLTFSDLDECSVVYSCDNRARAYALFRGSLSLVCGEHVEMVADNYDATFYNHGMREIEVE